MARLGIQTWSRNYGSIRLQFQVRASESLMKLISDIKQYLILNDFPSVNEAIVDNSKMFLELEVNRQVHSDRRFHKSANAFVVWFNCEFVLLEIVQTHKYAPLRVM